MTKPKTPKAAPKTSPFAQALVTGNNADLIAEVWKLYGAPTKTVADLTWGKGAFWTKVPHALVTGSDIVTVPERPYDFRATPYADASFDIAVLDPPYIHSPGKHMTDARYQNAATTKGMLQKDLRVLYRDGMREALRIVKPDGGLVWVKCKDQVQSGLQRWAHVEIFEDARALGFLPRDLFVLNATSRTSEGRWKVQHHARKPHSFLWIFERPNAAKTKQAIREGLLIPDLTPCSAPR